VLGTHWGWQARVWNQGGITVVAVEDPDDTDPLVMLISGLSWDDTGDEGASHVSSLRFLVLVAFFIERFSCFRGLAPPAAPIGGVAMRCRDCVGEESTLRTSRLNSAPRPVSLRASSVGLPVPRETALPPFFRADGDAAFFGDASVLRGTDLIPLLCADIDRLGVTLTPVLPSWESRAPASPPATRVPRAALLGATLPGRGAALLGGGHGATVPRHHSALDGSSATDPGSVTGGVLRRFRCRDASVACSAASRCSSTLDAAAIVRQRSLLFKI